MLHRGYILQWGNLAGWPYRIAKALRGIGYNSINIVPDTSDFEDLERQLPFDRKLYKRSTPKPLKLVRRTAFLREMVRDCAFVHYHGSVVTRVPWHSWLEGKLFDRAQIPMLMSFTGSDARIISQARLNNPYFYLEPNDRHDEKVRVFLRSLSKSIRYVATDCEMIGYVAPYFEKCFVFRQPVDLSEIDYQEPRDTDCPVVLHVPTNLQVKGTEFIVNAVERLRSEGYRFQFRLKRQLTQKEFYREMAACDIYADEIRLGAHGLTPVETMAAGKPTITYIREDLIEKYPRDLPLINSTPDTVYQKLKELITDADARRQIGIASRKYVEKYHDVNVVVRDLVKIYREIGY
jgi:glycosyltransferase involved in cell wall biosynthesis